MLKKLLFAAAIMAACAWSYNEGRERGRLEAIAQVNRILDELGFANHEYY